MLEIAGDVGISALGTIDLNSGKVPGELGVAVVGAVRVVTVGVVAVVGIAGAGNAEAEGEMVYWLGVEYCARVWEAVPPCTLGVPELPHGRGCSVRPHLDFGCLMLTVEDCVWFDLAHRIGRFSTCECSIPSSCGLTGMTEYYDSHCGTSCLVSLGPTSGSYFSQRRVYGSKKKKHDLPIACTP